MPSQPRAPRTPRSWKLGSKRRSRRATARKTTEPLALAARRGAIVATDACPGRAMLPPDEVADLAAPFVVAGRKRPPELLRIEKAQAPATAFRARGAWRSKPGPADRLHRETVAVYRVAIREEPE